MLGSGIIDVVIGLAFIFAATAALASVFTELIARFLGLRGAFLLGGLRELLDGTGGQTTLKDAVDNYDKMKAFMRGGGKPPPNLSAQGAPVGNPALPGPGMGGAIPRRDLA